MWPSSARGNWSHSPAFGCWGGTSANPALRSQCLCLFARKIYVQPWSLAGDTFYFQPWGSGIQDLLCEGQFFFCWEEQPSQVLLEPVDWDLNQQCQEDSTDSVLAALLGEASTKRTVGAEPREGLRLTRARQLQVLPALLAQLQRESSTGRGQGAGLCTGGLGRHLNVPRAETLGQVSSKDGNADLAKGIFLLGSRELLITPNNLNP